MPRCGIFLAMLSLFLLAASSQADPVWVVEPGEPGPDLPPVGRSLFDHLTARDGKQVVPFPYEALLAQISSRLDGGSAYLGAPIKQVLIPLGRSLQREAAAPNFFESPRVVTAVDAEPRAGAGNPGMLLRDRLYIGYLESADVLEIISYNEAAARFEFQIVTDYRDGADPQVLYARRLVCTACHQNAAPLFARPLWDETNSNAAVSARLGEIHGEYHGTAARVGVDIAYAIDNASDRANDFSLTQKLWQEACGEAEAGGECRAALLTRALQYAFSGGRGFDRSSDRYRQQLLARLTQRHRTLWPDGFKLPSPDIPNRRPLRDVVPASSPQPKIDAGTLLRLADVDAGSEPLALRPPLDRWDPEADTLVERLVQGLVQFLATEDIRRIDEHLAAVPVRQLTIDASCKQNRTTGQASDADTRIKLDCRGEELAFRAVLYQEPSGDRLHGQIRGLRLQAEELGSLRLSGQPSSKHVWRLQLQRSESPYSPRRFNADQLSHIDLHWQDTEGSRASAKLTLRLDGTLLQEAADRMARDRDDSLSMQPFQRARVMPALYASMGIESGQWCCVDDPDLPSPEVESTEGPLNSDRLAAFVKACAGCHRSEAPFPPNFLAGDETNALRSIAHCAERIQYRLAMWDLPDESRSKTPMPPTQSLRLHADEGRHWMSGLLPELRTALHDIAAAADQPLPSMQTTTARQYFDLRPCLPAT